jgi:hypothetical protein
MKMQFQLFSILTLKVSKNILKLRITVCGYLLEKYSKKNAAENTSAAFYIITCPV